MLAGHAAPSRHAALRALARNSLGHAGEIISPRVPSRCSAAVQANHPAEALSVSPAVPGVSHDQLYDPSPTHSGERLPQPDGGDPRQHPMPNVPPRRSFDAPASPRDIRSSLFISSSHADEILAPRSRARSRLLLSPVRRRSHRLTTRNA